jgi:hypothetical protein
MRGTARRVIGEPACVVVVAACIKAEFVCIFWRANFCSGDDGVPARRVLVHRCRTYGVPALHDTAAF